MLTVNDVLELENFKGFKLVAGAGGLARPVLQAGIMDFEFLPDVNLNRSAIFEEHSFVISSLFFAQKDEAVLYDAIKNLIAMGVSAMAYKNVFFRELPAPVIALANEENFAIFQIDDSISYEDIIFDLSLAMREKSYLSVMEMKLKDLIRREYHREEVKEVVERLFGGFGMYAVVFCCSAKQESCRFEFDRIVRDSSKRNREQQSTLLIRYGERLITIVTLNDRSLTAFDEAFQNLLESYHVSISDLCCGRSAVGKTVEQLDFLLKEAVYANAGTAILNKDFLDFRELGTFRFLMPYQDLTYMKNYRDDYLAPLLKCPNELDHDLLKTAITFVECGGRLKEVAKRLFIHENTARYRMNKLKEKLESNSTEYEFHVNLSCAVKLHILSKEKRLL